MSFVNEQDGLQYVGAVDKIYLQLSLCTLWLLGYSANNKDDFPRFSLVTFSCFFFLSSLVTFVQSRTLRRFRNGVSNIKLTTESKGISSKRLCRVRT